MRILKSLLFPDGSEQVTSALSVVSARAQTSSSSPPGVPGVDWTDSISLPAMAANYLYYYPFLSQRNMVFDQIMIEVLTGSVTPSSIRIGLYKADISLQPLSLVVDLGALDTTTTGVKVLSFTPQTLTPGRYLLGMLASSALPILRGWSGGQGLVGVNATLGLSYTTALRVARPFSSGLPTGSTPWDFVYSSVRFSYPLMMRYNYV